MSKTPTIEDIQRLVAKEYPGYTLQPGSKVTVQEKPNPRLGPVTVYHEFLPADIADAMADAFADRESILHDPASPASPDTP